MRPLKIGITCYPSVGGSGILATALGEELAQRGHEVHFISYERPFRLHAGAPRLHFHPVVINDYELFKYPDYTLPLSVKMAEVARDHALDVLHVHYAVPHATAAILARDMLPAGKRPRVVTTLHGTDTTLLGRDAGYGPAIRHALMQSDAVTAVSAWLRDETHRLLAVDRPIDVIHNFTSPRAPVRSREEVRRELSLRDSEAMIVHLSNLRPVKRVDLLLEAVARVQPREAFKLVILAGGEFAPFADQVRRLGIADRVIVRPKVFDVEDYLHAADLGLYSSESESFCLGILEAMWFGRPNVSTAVGGVPEVMIHGEHGVLVPCGDADGLARGVEALLRDPSKRETFGTAAQSRAREHFSADAIVPRYEALYRRVG
ncbi:MAG: N-acetyl-alpha-D-glucosaminyl L-malate synthase BshA [Opitutaceae bacterium]|nr:N-acetyl-alpha-D-glucosaminyl L-malate synthase BshA [Opitutaceae bacterium]